MSKTPNKRRHWHNDPWKYFYSLTTGVIILVILAVACIYATIKYKDLVDAQEHVYKSFNFRLLLIALGVNMTLATIRIIFDKILPMMRVRIHEKPEFYQTRKPAMSVPFSGIVTEVSDTFRAKGFKTRLQGNFGCAWKGKLSLWGAPVSHAGMVLVLISGLISFLWLDQEGSLTLLEGQQTDFRIDMAAYKDAKQNNPDFNDHWNEMASQTSYAGIEAIVKESGSKHDLSYFLDVFKPLGYTIRCEDFETAFHPRSRIVSKYISTVTSLDTDPPLLSEIVEVNRSVDANGWILHQSSYNKIDDPRATRYLLQLENAEIKDEETDNPLSMEMEISPGQERLIPGLRNTKMTLAPHQPFAWTITEANKSKATGSLMGTTGGYMLKVVQFEPDFVIGEGRIFTSRSRELNNPAALVSIISGGETILSRWLFQSEDMKKIRMGGGMHSPDDEGMYDLEFTDVSGTNPSFTLAIKVTEAGKPATTYNLKPGGAIGIAEPKNVTASNPGAWKVTMLKRVPLYTTTLSMTRNPLVPVIYFACFLMILGLCIAFMINRKEIWFWVDDQSNMELHVVGRYRYARDSMDPAVERILKQLGNSDNTE